MKFTALLGVLFCTAISDAAPIVPAVPVVQEGHSWDGSKPEFAISPDGKWVISSSLSRLKLWNAKGELVRDLEPLKFIAQTPVWARDSRQFFLTGKGGTAVYEMPAGRKTREIAGVEISGDGRFFIRRNEKTLRFSEVRTGKPLATVEAHPADSWLESLDFSPDGTLVAAGQPHNYAGSDGKVRIWNVLTGKLVRTLADPRGDWGKTSGVTGPVLWSKDGQTLVTGGVNPDIQEPAEHGPGFGINSFAIKVWDLKTGTLRHVWPDFGDGAILRDWLSPQEVRLSESASDTDSTILNIETGKTRSLENRSLSQTRHIVYLNNNAGYFELRAPNGKTLQEFPIRGFAGFEKMAYSPDGTLLAAAGGGGGPVVIYDARSGALKKVLPLLSSRGQEYVYSLKWLSNGNLSASSLQSAWIWEPNGKLVRRFAPPKSDFNDTVSVAPDGKLFLSGAENSDDEKRGLVNVWNGDGSLLRTIPDFGANSPGPTNWYDGLVVWIDNARVALPTKSGLEIWNLREGKRENQLAIAADFPRLRAVAASPDGKFLLCREESSPKDVVHSRTVLFETQNWRRYRNYENCAPLAWSADSSKFGARAENAEGKPEGTLIFSPQSATPLQKSALNSTDSNRQVAFSPDLKLAAMQSRDYATTHSQIWRVASGKLAVSLYLFANSTQERNTDLPPDAQLYWLALTPDGFYDGSPNIEKWLRWRRGDTLLPVGALENERRKPSEVRAALR